jgi:peroxiredoxin
LTEEEKMGAEIVAVSVDEKEMQQAMVDRIMSDGGMAPEFRILADPGTRVINRYGLFNAEESRGRPVPHPTTLVIDRDGVVRWRMTEVNYRIRPENPDILAALRALH